MIVYSSSITHRLRYICDFVGTELIGKSFEITDRKAEFLNFQGIRINYSTEKVTADEFYLEPHSLLFEQGIRTQASECFEVNSQKAFFKTAGDFHFDIFAASFYLLSRYEEYLPHQKDMYDRYAHENSLAFREGFLNLPLINIWLGEFRKSLQVKFPAFKFRAANFEFLPTYDIDEAYSYKHKQWWRSAGAAVKDLLNAKWKKFALRRKVLNNLEPDPFDSFDWMDNLHRPYQPDSYRVKPRYFFLVADKTAKYDRNILPNEIALQTLIKHLADKYKIGVHPSWQSGDDPSLIKKEINCIENITKIKIIASRQHYIRFTLPLTFRCLINAGIKDDFSMGYGTINGFRASVASPFYWYDLEKEETTYLLLHPFCYMEANSFYEQKFTPQQALDEMRHYYKEVKAVNGTLITIWHNSFLGTEIKFKGWREIYSQFLKEIF